MPLKKGSSQKVISENIKELENSKTKAGLKRTHAQNIAIAESEARKSKEHLRPGKSIEAIAHRKKELRAKK